MVGHGKSVGADVGRALCVFSFENAFDDQLPFIAQPRDILPGDRRVELSVDPGPKGFEVRGFGDAVCQIAEAVRSAFDPDAIELARTRTNLQGH